MPRRSEIPRGKRPLQVYISEELYNTLIVLAPQWYGKGRGGISAMVEEALKRYLSPFAHTNSHKPLSTAFASYNPKKSVRIVFAEVLEKLKEVSGLNYIPDQIPEKYLDIAIAEVRGSDPRTVNKWKNIFLKQGLIKYIGGLSTRIVEIVPAT